jgi:uncharacterized OB-fold protein
VTWLQGEPRELPVLDDLNKEFWTSGADGVLRVQRCAECRTWMHPPRRICRVCHSRELAYESTGGRGQVFSFAINRHPWRPGLIVPYVIALVELDEQDGLRFTTNVINCRPEEVDIGMPVQVWFDQQGEHFIPLFEPVRG